MTKEEIIKNSIKTGADRHATRRELISQGLSTEGFETSYTQILKEMGVSEPKPVMPVLNATGEVPLRAPRKSKSVSSKFIFLSLLLLAFFLGWYFFGRSLIALPILTAFFGDSGEQPVTTTDNASLGDGISKTKVDATMASVHLYRNRLLDYQGACEGVAVVPPIVCKENKKSLVLYAPIGKDSVYCLDSSGNTGKSVELSGELYRCK